MRLTPQDIIAKPRAPRMDKVDKCCWGKSCHCQSGCPCKKTHGCTKCKCEGG